MQNYKMVSANASVFQPIGVYKQATTTISVFALADTDEQVLEFAQTVVTAYNNGIVGFRTCNIPNNVLEDFTGDNWTPNHTFIVDKARFIPYASTVLSTINLMQTLGAGSSVPSLYKSTYNGHSYIALVNPT